MTEKGKGLIRQFESCKLVAYKCPAGKWTIGYGNRYYADGTPVKEGDKIDQETANRLLDITIEKFEKQVKLLLGDTLLVTLPKEAIDPLISFSFNVGVNAFAKSTLLKKIKLNKLDFDGIENEFNKWNKAGGQVLDGLTKRRKAEFQMYKEAVLSQYSKSECYQIGKTGSPK